MNKFKQAVLWLGLTLIVSLIFLSIYGAFIGAQRAKDFFNSLPLAIYWIGLTLLLMVGIFVFRRLIHVPGLLFIHAGCVLILAGSLWGSQAGLKLQKKLIEIDKIPAGQMAIFEGASENRVVLENSDQVKELPFHVRLKDFRLDYYQPEFLQVQTEQGKIWKFPVQINTEFSLGDKLGTLKVIRKFENLKLKTEQGKYVPYDDPQPGYNAALEVEIKSPDGQVTTRYAFERFPGHIHPDDKFLLSYQRVIREYISELQIIRDNQVTAEKKIEVNHPLHFGGYHFYQHSYDDRAGQYTILMVVSDTGVTLVYAGYLMLCIGVFWHFWLKHIFAAITRKSK